ncbi:MAG: cyclopropane-fatty-acyl-phospholipid synthase family protein [Verrucomicrobiota bacterium]
MVSILDPFYGTQNEMSADSVTRQILNELFGNQPFKNLSIRLWNDSYWPDEEERPATLVLQHPAALRNMLSPESEKGLAEAYIRNDFDIEGNMECAFELLDRIKERTQGWSKKLKIDHLLRNLPTRPCTENLFNRRASLHGRAHSEQRDRQAIQFHYDLSNEFYSLWLDPHMSYSCAYFRNLTDSLEMAQTQKLDYICQKLRLRPGELLLDIGCGWGTLVMHAVAHYGVRAIGITLSQRQADYAQERIRRLRLQNQIEIRLQDYREIQGERLFDKISSIGMVEHVGEKNLPDYFRQIYSLLKPGGLFLNHGIGCGPRPMDRYEDSFMDRYVFPDGELVPISKMIEPGEKQGFEVRDVENLREHYALTLRQWVNRLESQHDQILDHVPESIYRIWRLYMTGCIVSFQKGSMAIYQALFSKLDASGKANYPLTRESLYPHK